MAYIYILYTMLLFINECHSVSTLILFIEILTFLFSQIRFDVILYLKKCNIDSLLIS